VSGDDVFRLDRAGVRSSFDRASARYDAAAILQAKVREELLGRVDAFRRLEPRVVLDLGAGTGQGTRELKQRFPRALVIAMDIAPGMLREAKRHSRLFRRFERVCADALRIPLADASVDLIFSNLMLQWCNEIDAALAEIRRVLKPTGLLMFSTFGPDTLHELRTAWSQVDGYVHVNRFLDMHDIGGALMHAGLMEPVLDVDHHQLTYPDVMALMRDLKAIGAHNVTAGRPRGLMGRARMQKLSTAYEAFRVDDRLPATYEVVYGAAWGAAGKPAVSPTHGEAHIPVSAIRRRGKS
jgi:malonyl-CoA O-methyltransferase